ncbi:hypothetical protein VTO73DRAFT_8772 [Trametes versicolor]
MAAASESSTAESPGVQSDGFTSHFDETFGALLIGTYIGLTLFGLTVYQTVRYLRMYATDVQRLKVTVITVFLTDTTHSILCIHLCYYYLVTSQSNRALLDDGVWSIRLITPLTSIIVIVVQAFYARRIYVMGSQYKIPLFIVMALMLGEAITVMVTIVESFIIPTFSHWKSHAWLTALPYAFSLATDVILTSTLILILHKSRTGMRRTDSLLNVLIVYTINTGLLTSTLGIFCVVFATEPQRFYYIALNMPVTKSYANSMLAVLNSRRALAERAQDIRDLGTFGMTVPSITTANIAFDRRRASLSNRRLPTRHNEGYDDSAIDLSVLAHDEYSGADKSTAGGDIEMGPGRYNA